ncbi:MAG: hypothetical protein HYT12_03560 [Candidatus Liptonbacteria bacterium]|nr:hypothetical protein [Candidatus Liptonbacteria bacterium]
MKEIPEKKCPKCGTNQYLGFSVNCRECMEQEKRVRNNEVSTEEKELIKLALKNTLENMKGGSNQTKENLTETKEWVKLAFGILLGLFVLWIFFGGLLENQGNYGSKNTTKIDCRLSEWASSPYCNGEYEGQIQEQDATENNYYQNIVR